MLIGKGPGLFGGSVMHGFGYDSKGPTVSSHFRNGSISASLEDSSDYTVEDARCCHRVFERYSMIGENRVSMSIMLFQSGDSPVYLSAITSDGSQAVLFKINTWGEEAFLEKLKKIL